MTHDPSSARAHQRIAVIHNVDFQSYAEGAQSYEADAEVRETAGAVASILERNGYQVSILTVTDDASEVLPKIRSLGIDAVFNLVESLGGDASREPELPELLERAGIAYTGNAPSSLRLAHAKDETRRILAAHGVPIPRGAVEERVGTVPDLAELGLELPLFLKPARTDASIGIDQGSIARTKQAFAERLEFLRARFPGPYLIEEYLPGREVNVAIFPEPSAGHYVCTEIDFSACPPGVAPIVTYDCKWRPGTPEYAARSVPSKGRLPDRDIAAAQAIARDAFTAIGGRSYGRIDLRTGIDGRLYVIDVNPNPDIHPEAGLMIAARSIGIDHDALVLSLIELASKGVRNADSTDPTRRPRSAGRPPVAS